MNNITNSNDNKHLSLSDRITIEQLLNESKTFTDIADAVKKSSTAISMEVRKHKFEKKRNNGLRTNDCIYRKGCTIRNLCPDKKCDCLCTSQLRCLCTKHCEHYEPIVCDKLKKPPYVCNGCVERKFCHKPKQIYAAATANDGYQHTLRESRRGINISKDEFNQLDMLVSPLIKKGQSPSHIFSNHKYEIPCSERTLYRYLSGHMLSASLMDLQRQVRYKPRKNKNESNKKSDKECQYRKTRTYTDFINFTNEFPDHYVVEMDTVHGCEGSKKVLLTMFFRNCSLMLAFLMPNNSQESVISVFRFLQKNIETDSYKKLFSILLTDNGPEFKKPNFLEFEAENGEQVSHVFYCDPCNSNQKSRLERNHELIRYVVPKGKSFDSFEQSDITKLINHINSLSRESLNGRSPFEIAQVFLDKSLFQILDLQYIHPDNVHLKPGLLK